MKNISKWLFLALVLSLVSCSNESTKCIESTEEPTESTSPESIEEIENNESLTEEPIEKREYIYGVTVDSIENIEDTVEALKSFKKRMTTRLVFDEVEASEYSNAIEKLSPHTDIMGQVFDSEYVKNFDLESYKERTKSYMDLYGSQVAIWEIGNEVNGEWTGDPKEVAQKTIYAFEEAKKRGYKTALTLYYNDFKENDGCWANPEEKMREWAKKELNSEIKEGIDYLLVSYYEEDCDNHKPSLEEWNLLFNDLGKIFPQAKLGFGEVGTTDVAKKENYLKRYYGFKIEHPRYIGGHFWWYFKEEMVPKSKKLWSELNNIIK